jgi:hypothetical protein
MAFSPNTFTANFVAPTLATAPQFVLRPLTIHHVIKDYDAVMTSREHLWRRFGAAWGWPAADLSLEQDLIDLAWHQKEFQIGSSFAYSVLSLDESRTLGCVYIYPPSTPKIDHAADADVWFWARQSELASGLEQDLEAFIMNWLAENWPFKTVLLNTVFTKINLAY